MLLGTGGDPWGGDTMVLQYHLHLCKWEGDRRGGTSRPGMASSRLGGMGGMRCWEDLPAPPPSPPHTPHLPPSGRKPHWRRPSLE